MRVLLIALVLTLAACNRTPPAAQAESEATKPEPAKAVGVISLDAEGQRMAGIAVEPVTSKSIALAISAPGQLVFDEDRSWSTGSVADGRVAGVNAKLGDEVKAGQILATIHSHEVHDSRAELASAEQEVERAQSAEALARAPARSRRTIV